MIRLKGKQANAAAEVASSEPDKQNQTKHEVTETKAQEMSGDSYLPGYF